MTREHEHLETARRTLFVGFVAGVLLVVAATWLSLALFSGPHQLADVAMLYLLAVVLVSLRWGLLPSLLATVLSIGTLDFFFVPPVHAFAVHDLTHLATFAVLFVVSIVISSLTKRVRDQARAARERELRTASLYSLSGALSRSKTTEDVAAAGAEHVRDVLLRLRPGQHADAVILLPGADGHLADPTGAAIDVDDGRAEWVWKTWKAAGNGTDTFPASKWLYLPLESAGGKLGVLGALVEDVSDADRPHIVAFAQQIADALQRTRLADTAHEAQLRVQREQLRNSLLSSVSHDLRTPLAVITGTASALLDAKLDPTTRTELTRGILSEAERLNRLVRNLLDMTRLDAGAVEPKKEWQPVEETVGAALERVEGVLGDRPVTTNLPADLPLVPYDSILLQQVFVNLLENAAKYTPPGTEIAITARAGEKEVEVSVGDRGPGLPPGEELRIFDKFYRAEKGRGGGVGLGLTICQGIVTAHRGRIWARNREGGGAEFRFTLPIEGAPPAIDEESPS